MTETPFPRLDPTRLHEERHEADLGDDTGFDRIKKDDAEDAVRDTAINDSTAGVSPPAR